MKILLLNDTDTPTGGAELMTLSLKNEFQNLGHEVRIFSSNAATNRGNSFSDYQCFGTVGKFRTLNRAYNFSAYWELKKFLKSFKPDVVHVRMFFTQISPSILPLLKNVPSVYHATWLEAVCPTGVKLLPNKNTCRDKVGIKCYTNGCLSPAAWIALIFQNKLFHFYKKHFNVFVANSEAVRTHLLSNNINPVEVIYNGVPSVIERNKISDTPIITCSSRLSNEKGIDILIKAFALIVKQFPNTILKIAGDGDQKAKLEQLIIELKLNDCVIFLGHQTRKILNAEFEDAWIHIVPSICEEGFGLTAAEAMMRSTAVIASDLGGLSEIVDHGISGYLIPPNDQTALENNVITLLGDKNKAIQMGIIGRKKALEKFSTETCAQNFLDIYNSII
jgi:glycosyltransferase involved in cell wall biosynthesis